MAWTKSLRNILGGSSQSLRAEFFEEKQVPLSEASTLSAIRNISSKVEQNKLLIKKLRICSTLCDFRLAEEGGDANEKKKIFNKTSMLHEICTYLREGYEWNTLEVITQIFTTVSRNLFRPIPDSYLVSHLMGVDHIVPITYTIPKWQHLEIIYEIIELTFSNQSINQLLLTEYIKKYDFISNFVYLLNTKDKNERHHIQQVLETFYNEHGNLFEKELIYNLCNYCMDFIHYQIGTADGIKSILNIFNSMSLIDEEIYSKILIPLHKMEYKYFRRYEFVLWIYCKRIIEEDETLSLILFKYLLQIWPLTNPLKEQQFLKKIAVIIDFIDEDIWQDVNKYKQPKQYKLFEKLAYKILYCLQNSNHYKTIIDILDIIEQEEIQEFIDKYGGEILWTKIYQSLYDITKYFFFFETIKKVKETMEILKEHDDIPMKYKQIFIKIESNDNFRIYPLNNTCFKKDIKTLKNKKQKREKRYNLLIKKAHSTQLYKRVQKEKEIEEKNRILKEENEKKEREKKALLKKQKELSTPQKYNPPKPPPKKLNTRQRSGHNIINILNNNNDLPSISSVNSEPPLSPKRKKSKPPPPRNHKYNIIPKNNKKKSDQILPNSPKMFFKKSQSATNVHSNNNNNNWEVRSNPSSPNKKHMKFWIRDRDRPNSPRKKLPNLPKINKSNSEKNIEKLRAKQLKQYQKEEKARIKAEKKAEKQKQKDVERERKKEEKRVKKEIKKMEKEVKRGSKNRIRKSIDIDKRTSISNPIQPSSTNSDAFNKYTQFNSNNSVNHYLNTQYYAHNGQHIQQAHNITIIESNNNLNEKDYNKSPKLQFSYSPSATYDPPNVPNLNNNNNNSNPPYRRARKKNNNNSNSKSVHNNNIKRSRTPPPPRKNESKLAKAKPLEKNHPLHKDNKYKMKNKAASVNNINTNNIKPPPHSGGGKKRLPPRPWPPVSKST